MKKKPRGPHKAKPAPKQSTGIVLGVPAYGGNLTATWVYSILPVLMAGNFIERIERIENDSHVGRARNSIAAKFLENGGEWLLFIDTDIGFTPADLKRVYSQAMRHPTDITGGVYPLKRLTPGAVVNAMPGEKPDETGLIKVREMGTGFMFIPRCVLENMAKEYPEISFTKDEGAHGDGGKTEHDFFQSGVWKYKNDPHFADGRTRWLSEDYFFCQRHIEMGGDIWLDASLKLKHRGALDYPADEGEVRSAAAYFDRLHASAEKAKEAK